ncbi:MAG: 6-phosphofructokinase [Gammaproteobacteria bacterium]|nr:6-phosphofructokinase [Gammaproteobacteria bacterium]|tara:strand:- start:70087 stop:71331 length:1245 start_codon:yes stop_codon:yes gene_type:complete
MKKNIFYAQSGGVTPVINATASGIINSYLKNKKYFGKFFAGKNGIIGALNEELIDVEKENINQIKLLKSTPGGAFGSCRLKLKSPREFQRILDVFKAHNIGYFFYNGGGDSQDTTNKLNEYCKSQNYSLVCIGLPKTIDNDLSVTDNCPGFGSVAKYIAVSTYEASLDVQSMCQSSTKVFLLEVMGRHAGWLAASSGVLKSNKKDAPHIILFPEKTFVQESFLKKVKNTVNENGYCVIVASEGIKNSKNQFISDSGGKDSFGHAQLGGVAPILASLINKSLKYKVHWSVADYLQRAARHVASKIDVQQAYTLGMEAIKYAKIKKSGIMLTIDSKKSKKYSWSIGYTDLKNVANKEKRLPKKYISNDGYAITQSCRQYISNLINGEDYPKYKNGLPLYSKLRKILIKKKLDKFEL